MASITQVYFRVKRMAYNGFDVCRYSQKYGVYVDKDLKPIPNPALFSYRVGGKGEPIIDLLADFFYKCPELENEQKCKLVYHGKFRAFTYFTFSYV